MYGFWTERLNEHASVIEGMVSDDVILKEIDRAARMIVGSYRGGGKLLICGNGGSAADSQHIATELVSRFLMERAALDAEALTVNASSLTAIGNDYSFDKVFSRQVEAKGRSGDLLLGITTSGNSKNVIEAVVVAGQMGMKTIGLTGDSRESLIYRMTDCCIGVPSGSTPRIQEAHILIGHMICELIEHELFGPKK